jgi:hypothetical protein
MSYKIVRKFFNGRGITIHRNLTLEEAQEYCNNKESSSETCTTKTGKDRTRKYGLWFDCYYKE